MRDIWLISDTHWGHRNIINYCDRPFSDENEMDEALINNWNSVVKDGDIVYHLGDVYWFDETNPDKPPVFHNRLKGRKRLIMGNHDNYHDPWLPRTFKKIMQWRPFPEFDIVLTHQPLHPEGLEHKWKFNIHGHTHQSLVDDDRYINVSVEQINYTPINIMEIIKKIAA